MRSPTTITWNLGVSYNDTEKLRKGFQPSQMEDRWKCHADEPNARGDFVVHVHRSWTGDEQFRMNVILAGPVAGDVSAPTDERHATITELTWDKGEGQCLATEDEAKELASKLCRGVLGCDL